MAEKRYVEANALREDAMKRAGVSEFTFYNCYPYWQFSKSIDEAPTADVVEVVRCKDCESYIRYPKLEDFDGRCVGCIYPHDTDEDDYCSYGKRKETK